MDGPRTLRTSISSLSSLEARPSNSSAGYCRTCSSTAILCAELYAQFDTMREDEELCDIVISVKSSSYKAPAHRLILAAKSPFLKQHFIENKTATEFEFAENISAEGVKSILEYMYENELIVSSENVEDLTRIAVLLELSNVVDHCCSFMTNNFGICNYEHYISLAEELNLPWLLDRVFLFLEWNFVEIVESEGFTRLKDTQMNRLLCSKGLRVGYEETLYLAIMKWYNCDTTNRKESLESIFEKMNFPRMSPKFLEERVIPDLVKDLGICEDKVTSAQLLQQTSYMDVWSQGRYRNTNDAIYVFSSSDALVERFDKVRSTCVPCPEMNRGASVKGNGDLPYAVNVGGDLFLMSSRRVFRLNAEEMRWASFADGISVTDAGVCGGEKSIYVVGGKQSRYKAVKRLLVQERKWTDLPPMNNGRRGPGVVCHSNVLYVMGGYDTDKSGPLAAVESFDLVSEEWSSLPSMRVPRFRLSCVILDGKIFAMGGRDNVRNFLTVETFDTENKKWNTPDNHMIRARDEFCATVHEGMIYCFGGRGVQNIECCDPNSGGVWKDIGVMGEGKSRTGASCVTFTPFFDDLPHQF